MTSGTVVSLDQYRARLQQLRAQGRRYEYVNQAGHLLAQAPQEVSVRLQVIRELARIGLPEVAVSLVDRLPEPLGRSPQARQLVAQLERLPGALVPWSTLALQFEANLRALCDRGGDCDALRDAWRSAEPRLRAYVLPDGNHQIAQLADDGGWQWLLPLGDYKTAAARSTSPHGDETLPAGYVLEGLGYGWYLPTVYADTARTFHDYSSSIHVLEPDAVTLAINLHLHDWQAMIEDERVHVFWGPDAVRQWADLLGRRLDLPLPKYQLKVTGWTGPISPPIEGALQQLKRQRDAYCDKAVADARAAYAERDAAWYARRFSRCDPADPWRAMCFVSRYTTFLKYSVRDLAEGLRNAGWRVEVVTEPTDHSLLLLAEHARAVADFQPDVLFVADHLRSEFKDVLPPELIFVTWAQDRLSNLLSAEAARQFSLSA
jgi:hypothetical protein